MGHVEKAYRAARKAYDLRSDVMHGSRSQDDEHLLINTGLVHDLTREAVLGALAMHHILGNVIGASQTANITRFFEQTALRHEALFDKLQQEFRKKMKSKRVIP
jgi:hypothetical protein